MQLIRQCSDIFRSLIGSVSVVLKVHQIINRRMSCKLNEYVRETAVMVAITIADIRFYQILYYILCLSKLKARFRRESKQRLSSVLSPTRRQSCRTVRLLSLEHIGVVQILGSRSYFMSLIGTYFCWHNLLPISLCFSHISTW